LLSIGDQRAIAGESHACGDPIRLPAPEIRPRSGGNEGICGTHCLRKMGAGQAAKLGMRPTRMMPGYRWLSACLRRSGLSTQLSWSRCRGSVAHWRYARLCAAVAGAARGPVAAVVLDLGDHLALGGHHRCRSGRCCTARTGWPSGEIAGCVGWMPINPTAPNRLPAVPITAADADLRDTATGYGLTVRH